MGIARSARFVPLAAALAGALVGTLVGTGRPASATVPGVNGRILYYSGGNGLFTMDPDGRNKLRVAQAGTAGSWSPDGSRIVWVKADSEIWTMNADGSGKALLLDPNARVSATAWSPDGATVAFAGDLDDPHPFDCSPCNYDLYTVGLDGTGLRRLTSGPAWEDDPEWSPDGIRLVYGRIASDLHTSVIAVVDADGTGAHVLNSNLHGFYPSWSPDGSRIAFTGTPTRQDPPRVYAMRADGSGVRGVSAPGEYSQMPSWSPDGARIAFIHAQDPAGVWVMDRDGSGQHTLTPGQGDLFGPKWGPRPQDAAPAAPDRTR